MRLILIAAATALAVSHIVSAAVVAQSGSATSSINGTTSASFADADFSGYGTPPAGIAARPRAGATTPAPRPADAPSARIADGLQTASNVLVPAVAR